MTGCPHDSALRRLADDVLPAAAADPLERHLDVCERCRKRLDALSDVTAVGLALGEAAGRPAASPELARVLDHMRAEPTEVSGPTAALPPTGRSGFIGRLGGIEIRRIIGRGGMGVVYEGLDQALDRPVAVKVLSPHLLGDSAARERFVREARAAAALAHEHVVTIHAIDQHDGTPYLVLQYVAGESLADRLIREGKVPVEQAARIGSQIARGLAAAHARGLIHRDVKPANVLLEAGSDRVRLTDFGLAKLVGGDTITSVGTVAGTPAYMSPEQAAGQPVDARSDLFSLGVVLYAAAAGRLPFAGDSPHAVLYQIRERAPKPLIELDPALPGWFCSIIGRLMEKDPARRIQTAAEAADLLERRATAPRARRLRRAAVATALVGAVGIGIAIANLDRTPPAPENMPVPEAPATVPPGFVVARTGNHFKTLAEAVQAAADGDTIEVHGEGPHLERRTEIRDKRLTVRAAAGARPRIQPAMSGKTPSTQWINTDAGLTLEGLDIHWPVAAEKLTLDGSLAVVDQGQGQLTIRGCQIVCGKRAVAVAARGNGLTVEASHIIGDGGVAVWSRSVPGGSMRVSASTIEGDFGVWMFVPKSDEGAGTEPTAVELTDNTIVAKGVWSFVYPAIPKQTVRIDARRNLVSASYLFGMPTLRPTAADAPAALRGLVGWEERDNVYDRNCVFLSAVRPSLQVIPSTVKTLDDWAEFWPMKPTGSVVGDVRFRPRPAEAGFIPPRLDRVEKATGPLPAAFGAPLANGVSQTH